MSHDEMIAAEYELGRKAHMEEQTTPKPKPLTRRAGAFALSATLALQLAGGGAAYGRLEGKVDATLPAISRQLDEQMKILRDVDRRLALLEGAQAERRGISEYSEIPRHGRGRK